MTQPTPAIRVAVEPTNPGQFFACCGLLELADRLWPGAEGWFSNGHFNIACGRSFADLIRAIATAAVKQLDPEDVYASPIEIGEPFRPLRLAWWHDESYAQRRLNGKELKTWAGRMECMRIARAMQQAIRHERFLTTNPFDISGIVLDADDPTKKVEPYYFDCRRGGNAHSRDIGFSPNDLEMRSNAFPAVELLCLIGLEVARPQPTGQIRVYDYFTWGEPMPSYVLLVAAAGLIELPGRRGFRFECGFRDGQRKNKAFMPAVPLPTRGER